MKIKPWSVFKLKSCEMDVYAQVIRHSPREDLIYYWLVEGKEGSMRILDQKDYIKVKRERFLNAYESLEVELGL